MTVKEAKDKLLDAIAGSRGAHEHVAAIEDLIRAMIDNHVPKPRCRCYTVDSGLKYPCLLPEGHTDYHQFSRTSEAK